MPGALRIVIVYNKSNTFGISNDAKLLAEALPSIGRSIGQPVAPVKLVDCREPPSVCDICIHLEVPYAVWFPWARINAIVVNTEWWEYEKWSGYLDSFDLAIFRDKDAQQKFVALNGSTQPRETCVVQWSSVVGSAKVLKDHVAEDKSKGFVWFLGGSHNKRAAAEAILPLWKESYPPLTVYATEPLVFETPVSKNVSIKTTFLKDEEKKTVSKAHAGHVCLSKAESFGYTASEAESLGAYCILNTIPCYKSAYGSGDGIGWLNTPINAKGFAEFTNTSEIQSQLDGIIADFLSVDLKMIIPNKHEQFQRKCSEFMSDLETVLKTCVEAFEYREDLPRHMPPLLNPEDCPPISIITLVHNRPKFIENACLNLLSTDYPRNKIEWVVVDDSEPEQSPSNRIIHFSEKFNPGEISYIPLLRKHTIGEKRNMAIEKAKHDIIVMMDDDDHYPSTSFRRRVAYLLKGRNRYDCATCTTIAMYDLMKGTSAVNVPPYTLSLAERCSEATLTFTKDFWKSRKFPEVDMAEGEGFLKGRESQVVEMPPQQLIVALSHGTNLSSRKMPDANPGCFWGFPRQLLEFLHSIVGVKVEAV
jgi:hypothetical protein